MHISFAVPSVGLNDVVVLSSPNVRALPCAGHMHCSMTGIMPIEHEWDIIESFMNLSDSLVADPNSPYFFHAPMEVRYITISDAEATMKQVRASSVPISLERIHAPMRVSQPPPF